MSERKKKKNKTPYQNWLVPGVIGLVFLVAIGFLVKVMLTDVGPRKKEQIATVTLIKPPPPEVKEKPPEPEIQKEAPKETIVAPTEAPQNQAQDQPQDDGPPAGSDLGVDGEGGAGSDAFGLVGKKGGRAITLGGGGGGGLNRLSLLTKYGGYTQKLQEEIKKRVRTTLDQNGGIPQGKLQAVVKITLDAGGRVVRFKLVGSSGNDKMDEAVRMTLSSLKMSEPPPEGMPAGMTLKITSQG
jgi:TonB family protein